VALWITPIRALATEIKLACERPCADLNIAVKVGSRTGDTKLTERAKQKKQMPHLLITTPESLHLLLSQKEHENLFKHLQYVVVDEWHELLGSKRGVQVELALSRLRGINPLLQTWGISATIGNIEEAKAVLLPNDNKAAFVKHTAQKEITIKTIFPNKTEAMPWAGHLGIKLLPEILPIIQEHQSTLIFTNTRAQSEIWYHQLLEQAPFLAGLIALHHGSLSEPIRAWVENALHEGKLKAVVCTSSLDLGVDFRPVDAVIQVGSPKGVARFLQRAGRSGHRPGEASKIFFLPTNALEIIESAALKNAVNASDIEYRPPYVRSFDVLIQYLITLAVGGGFVPEKIFSEIKNTHCFSTITTEEWQWILSFIKDGGNSLRAYNEYHKVVLENGTYKVVNRGIAMRHRLSIGTIVSDAMLMVKFIGGKKLGSIEEWFISKLNPGDVFWFAGRSLLFVQIKDLQVLVKSAGTQKGIIPAWTGGRMSLSAQLGNAFKDTLIAYNKGVLNTTEELQQLKPLFELQQQISLLPGGDVFLIEQLVSKEGHHLFFYPVEGRFVHEGMAAIIAYRIAEKMPATFSIALNDYGFELLSDTELEMDDDFLSHIFSLKNLPSDILKCINVTEMAKRRFRDIACISGLVFNGFPGKPVKTKHLQSSSQLFFKVFEDYEPQNLLLRQAYDEVLVFQLEEARLKKAFLNINEQKITVKKIERPGPFAFPIMVDRLREKFSNENIEIRIEKMLKQYAS
jgi:ATP-dependent Lhr-like helicase